MTARCAGLTGGWWCLLGLLPAMLAGAAQAQAGLAQSGPGNEVSPRAMLVRGDGVPRPLTAQPGDPARGRAIVVNRQQGLCLLCHSGPFPEERFQGDLAPSLAGAGSRNTPAQLRLRIADPSRLNPSTIMPSYYRMDGLQQVAPAWQGKTILSAQQIEDVVAFLATLRE